MQNTVNCLQRMNIVKLSHKHFGKQNSKNEAESREVEP